MLVSLLEKDNDMYDGIYTVPQSKFKDMFVVSPQDFTKIAATRTELAVVRNYNVDVANFEEKFNEVRDKLGKHYNSAVDKHNSAVEEIDKIIKEITKMCDFLTVKKLAKNSPSILALVKGKK